MKKLIFILLLLPLFAYPQAEKRHRSVIIDSLKALNGGIIDIKDSASFEKPVGIGGILDASALLTLTDTAQGFLVPRMTAVQRNNITSPATGLLVFDTDSNAFLFFDSSIWMKLVDVDGGSINTIYSANDNLTGNRVVTMGANNLTFSGNLTTFKGIDATSSNFGLKVQDNVGTDLFNVRNDGNVGIGTTTFGTNAVRVFGLKAGTAPITNITDVIQMYSTDGVDLNIRNEAGTIKDLFSDGGIYGGSGSLTTGTTIVTMATNVLRFANTADANTFKFQGNGHISIGATADNGSKLNITAGSGESPFKVDAFASLNAIFVTSDGDVGVGISTPDTKLEIFETASVGAEKPILKLDYTNYGNNLSDGIAIQFGTFNDIATDLSSASNIDFLWRTWSGSKIERMRLTGLGNLGIGITPLAKLHVNGTAIIDSSFSTTARTLTLGGAATTFVVTSNVMTITGDGSGNTIATITGANSGQYLILIFVDGLVTLTDDNGHGANTLDLSGAFTSVDDTTIHLIFNGVSWYEISRSTN